jgi:hypothetical protein
MLARTALTLLFAVTLALCAPTEAWADRFVLTSGGVIEGTLLNRQQTPRTTYEIETKHGVRMALPAAAVAEVTRQKDAEREYAARAPTYRDTAADQWKLAEWCRQHDLKAERLVHLRRIIEHEPDHVQARHLLGYVQLQGEWTTQEASLASKGYKLYRGKWRSPQDIALIQEREKASMLAREWLSRLKRWRVELNDARFAADAYNRIAAIRDGAAVMPLCEMLRLERDRDVKALYVETLGQIGTAQAIEALVRLSLNDPDVEIFHTCVETLLRAKPPNLSEPYLTALKNTNNVRINRAAYVLGMLDDKSAVAPLIEVLVTTHKVVVGPSNAKGDAISTSFGGNGNSFQTGDSPKVFSETTQNREVLDALTRLSGGLTFGYDVPAWRRWHAAERSRGPAIDLKR